MNKVGLIGITIDDILNKYGYEIFDFDYEWENVTLFGEEITKEVLQNKFIEYYQYYPISVETIESFKFELKRLWLKNIKPLNMLIKSFPTDITLEDTKKIFNGELEMENKFSDTPNQPMEGEEAYLTYIAKNKNNNSSTETESKNPINKFYNIYNKYNNIMYDFYDKFNNLFSTLVIITKWRYI